MNKRPYKPCNEPGCNRLTKVGYCDLHKEKAAHRQRERKRARESKYKRESSTKRGYGTAWRKARAGFLRRNPACVHCKREGLIIKAEVVDHKIPHKGNRELFWNRENWQPLCKRHHDIKTATEDGGFGRDAGPAIERNEHYR